MGKFPDPAWDKAKLSAEAVEFWQTPAQPPVFGTTAPVTAPAAQVAAADNPWQAQPEASEMHAFQCDTQQQQQFVVEPPERLPVSAPGNRRLSNPAVCICLRGFHV